MAKHLPWLPIPSYLLLTFLIKLRQLFPVRNGAIVKKPVSFIFTDDLKYYILHDVALALRKNTERSKPKRKNTECKNPNLFSGIYIKIPIT